MSKRIYVVRDSEDVSSPPSLVKATSQAAAIRAIVDPRYTALVATQEDLVLMVRKGIDVKEGN